MAEPRWTSSLTEVIRYSEESDVAVRAFDDQALVIPRAVADLLLAAKGSLRTRGQLESFARERFSLTPRSARELISEVTKTGLFMNESEVISALAAKAENSPSEQIEQLVISTCDRPDQLRRCLRSHLESARQLDRSCRVLIADDSRRASNRAANQKVIVKEGKHFESPIDYLGVEEKRRLAGFLTKASGVPRSVVRFLLGDPLGFGYTPGANRNAALLALPDRAFLIADDDTRCRGLDPPNAETRLAFAAVAPEPPFRFPQRKGTMNQRSHVLAEAEQWLGKGPAALFPRSGAELEGLLELMMAHPEKVSARDARVAVVLFGMLGDHGMPGPASLLWVEGEGREEFLRSRKSYRTFTERAHVLWALQRPTISQRVSVCSGATMALDNRRSLPPFPPGGRSEDTMFAAMLELSDPSALFAVSTLAIAHREETARSFPPEAKWSRLATASLNSSLIMLLRHRCSRMFEGRGARRSAEENLGLMGTYFLELGELDFGDAMAHLAEPMKNRNLALAGWLRSRLDATERRPAYWADDVEQQVRRLEESQGSAHLGWPGDLGTPSPRAYQQRLQPVLRLLGAALQHWPALRAASQRLGEENLWRRRRLTQGAG